MLLTWYGLVEYCNDHLKGLPPMIRSNKMKWQEV